MEVLRGAASMCSVTQLLKSVAQILVTELYVETLRNF